MLKQLKICDVRQNSKSVLVQWKREITYATQNKQSDLQVPVDLIATQTKIQVLVKNRYVRRIQIKEQKFDEKTRPFLNFPVWLVFSKTLRLHDHLFVIQTNKLFKLF